jgi:hypothetical protein
VRIGPDGSPEKASQPAAEFVSSGAD